MPTLRTYAGRSVKNKNRKKTTTNNKQQSWTGMPNLRTCYKNNKIMRHPEFISGSEQSVQSVNKQAQSDDLFEIIQSSHPQDIQIPKYSSSTLPCKLHYIQQQEELQVRNDDMLFID